ncbi:DUF368 domain-containing protein [Porticoccus sp. W117]|uniref:DUF368 domain-containing protein n=1 Tax=Porticoccus sp. W117 TaxID=3054777 RepID=UPI002594D6EA|nr:DUF368 domain-containing protein [Porticoccus sp. W117]MDM3870292.1 DUF368 domain-containing protein [Porticoccus sp. W117]
MRGPVDYLLLFFKGAAMGAADVVPGVSGGTIAFISGIYQRLLNAIRAVNLANLKRLLCGDIKGFWQVIDGTFLAVLFTGILLSILSLAKLVSYGMQEHPILLWSFFFGLIVASIIWMLGNLDRWRWQEGLAIIVGTAAAAGLFWMPGAAASESLLMIFAAGAVAICAMILPGISGSFILVLIGLYPVLIEAISELQVVVLMVFAGGCLVGLMSFSRLLGWLLEHYRSTTLGLLTGFLVGSLAIVWPWKEKLIVMFTASGKEVVLEQRNLLPGEYWQLFGDDPQTWPAILLALLGVALVLGLERLGGRHKGRV